jgi:hypothetical protein
MDADHRTSGKPRAPNAWSRVAIVAVTVLFLIVAMHTPVGVLGDASHDDGLFMHHAISILDGNWLGPYDQLTLAKGPGYALLLVVGYFSGLSVTLLHALLYLLGVLCVSLAFTRLTGTVWMSVLLFAVLLMHPAALPLRVIRDSIYGSQVLLLCGASIFLLLDCRDGRFRPLLAIGAGLLSGWIWLTREEGLWLIPGPALMVLGIGWLHRRGVGATHALIKTTIVVVVVAVGVNFAYSSINRMQYGKFVAVDFKEANFVNALAALQGVRGDETVPFVPVPRDVRDKVFAVSPSFAELREYFDAGASPDSVWGRAGCRVYPSTCGDIAGGWFVWALRDAAASRGYYRSPDAASMYFERLTNEIRDACNRGRLSCTSSAVPFMPQVTSTQLHAIPATTLRAIELLTFIDRPPRLDRVPSTSNARIDDLLGQPLRTAQRGTGTASVDPPAGAIRDLRKWLIAAYAVLLPLLGGIGLATWLVRLTQVVRKRAQVTAPFVIASALWVMVATRIAVVVLVDISAFPAINQRYLVAAYPLLCMASVLGISGLAAGVPGRGARREDQGT